MTADNDIGSKVAQTLAEFVNTASEFDGKSEKSLQLVEAIKDEHEPSTVSSIKTKLKGNARNLICEENSIADIINKLKVSVKGESDAVLSAKLMSIKQSSKTQLHIVPS